MLRRLKRDVMAQLPRKRRQVVRLPRPSAADWAAAGGELQQQQQQTALPDQTVFELRGMCTQLQGGPANCMVLGRMRVCRLSADTGRHPHSGCKVQCFSTGS